MPLAGRSVATASLPAPSPEEEAPQVTLAGRSKRTQTDPWYVRWALIGLTFGIVGLLIVVPLVSVFVQATAHGLGVYWTKIAASPETRHAVFLSFVVAPVAVAMNVVFGIAAAWAIARFRFPGRGLLTTLIDVPFTVSPVVAGLLFVLLFGAQCRSARGCATMVIR